MYFTRIKTAELYPPFLKKVAQLQDKCLKAGSVYYATSGYRSTAEQNGLHALGRTVKNTGASASKPMGDIVTNAKGGSSFHNFGIAIDFALDSDTTRAGLQPDWTPGAYKKLMEECPALGLESGGAWVSFKDYPHVQLPIQKHSITLAKLRELEASGGMAAVWKHLDGFQW